MSAVPNLLNDDQTASIATALMMSHHGFRRDLARFETALEKIAEGDSSRIEALREEWKSFCDTLHGHHHSEDTGVFPNIAVGNASLRAVAARAAFDARCERVWGSARAGAARTPIPHSSSSRSGR